MGNLHYKLRAPRSLSEQEVELLLRTTGDHVAGLRDHVTYSLAVGTGLRVHELVALDWPQLLTSRGHGMRETIQIAVFKGCRRTGGTQDVRLPGDCRRKLYALWVASGRPRSGPVFLSRHRDVHGPSTDGARMRMSTRQMRRRFTEWQEAAGFERRYTFHALRHTYCRRLMDATKDITIVRRAARHARIDTTAVYLEPSDEQITKAIRRLKA